MKKQTVRCRCRQIPKLLDQREDLSQRLKDLAKERDEIRRQRDLYLAIVDECHSLAKTGHRAGKARSVTIDAVAALWNRAMAAEAEARIAQIDKAVIVAMRAFVRESME